MFEFFKNLFVSIFRRSDLKKARKDLDRWAVVIKAEGIHGMRKFMSQFKWRKESTDWTPDGPEVVVANGYKDDCDGAAVLAKWAFHQLGMPSHYYRLKGKTNHRICVTDNLKWFTSNGDVVEIPDNMVMERYVLKWGWHRAKGYEKVVRV